MVFAVYLTFAHRGLMYGIFVFNIISSKKFLISHNCHGSKMKPAPFFKLAIVRAKAGKSAAKKIFKKY
jgi:hypothetical protein